MKLVLCKFPLGWIYHVSYSDFTLRNVFFFSWPLLATGLNLSMLAIIGTPAFIWEIYCSSSGERPVRSPWQLIKYSESFTHPHSSSCSDLNVSLILTNGGLWTGQISAFQSTSSWINNFFFSLSAFLQASCGGGGQWSRFPRATGGHVRPRWSNGSPAWWSPATAGDTAPGLSASLRSVTLHPNCLLQDCINFVLRGSFNINI